MEQKIIKKKRTYIKKLSIISYKYKRIVKEGVKKLWNLYKEKGFKEFVFTLHRADRWCLLKLLCIIAISWVVPPPFPVGFILTAKLILGLLKKIDSDTI